MELKEGIIVKSNKYLENSKILYILTNAGLESYLVKGGMKLTHKANSYTKDISLVEFDVQNGKGFNLFTTGKLLNSYINIKSDYKKIEAIYLIFELILEFSSHVNDNETLYTFTKFILGKIENTHNEKLNYSKYYYLIFATKLLYLLGVGPEFSRCVRCHSKENLIGFDFNSSGMICEKCISNNELFYSREIVNYTRVLYLTKPEGINDEFVSKLFYNNDKEKEISTFILRYYNTYLGFKSKTAKVLNLIKN